MAKRELMEILLDSITPSQWLDDFPYAAMDYNQCAVCFYSDSVKLDWSKPIIRRDDFVRRYEEKVGKVNKTQVGGIECAWGQGIAKALQKASDEADKKEQKLSKSKVDITADSEGWIQWGGGEMPVEKGTLIDVKYRNGKVNLHVSAGILFAGNGTLHDKSAINWVNSMSDWSIIAYRLHKPNEQKTPKQLALEKYGVDWIDNDGIEPQNEMFIDIQLLKDGVVNVTTASMWNWDIDCKNRIVKWRVHQEKSEELKMNYEKLTFTEIDDKVALLTRQRDEAALTMNTASDELIKLLDAKLAKIKSALEQ